MQETSKDQVIQALLSGRPREFAKMRDTVYRYTLLDPLIHHDCFQTFPYVCIIFHIFPIEFAIDEDIFGPLRPTSAAHFPRRKPTQDEVLVNRKGGSSGSVAWMAWMAWFPHGFRQ